MRKLATVGWYVVGILDDDEVAVPHMISRLYQSKEAADDFAALARQQCTRHPESVLVRTRSKVDKINPSFG